MLNADTSAQRLRRRVRELERALLEAADALEGSAALTIGEKDRLVTRLRGTVSDDHVRRAVIRGFAPPTAVDRR